MITRKRPHDCCSSDEADICPICLDELSGGGVLVLPCAHTFHAACVAGLRAFGVSQVCPLCRADLPPCPDQLCDAACRRYFVLVQRLGKGLPGEQMFSELYHRDPA